jgi:CRISPR-associated protein Cmr2
MQFLLLVSIGPVQDFIASARRSRDLWFGSELLSELSKCVACWITDKYGVESLIFPAPESLADLQQQERNVANKILAYVTVKDKEGVICTDEQTAITQLRANAHATKETIYKELDAHIKRIHEKTDEALLRYKAELSMYKGASVDWKTVVAQIHDLVEYSWVALPFNEGHDSYREQRKYLEALLAARKNTRDYQQVSWGGPQHKSSIDGHLESVIPEIYYPRAQTLSNQPSLAQSKEEQERTKKTVILFNVFRAGPAEQLSGVDLLKRLGTFGTLGEVGDAQEDTTTEENFLSTSHIAAQPYLARLTQIAQTSAQAKDKLLQSWHTYIQTAQSLARLLTGETSDEEPLWLDHIPRGAQGHEILGRYDGALLFGERLLDKAASPEQYREAQNALKGFFDTVDDLAHGKVRLNPYYAIILADGDGMGKAIDHLADQSNGIAHHRQLSRGLDQFAQNVRKIVLQHQGAPIYAGGDDVLAFLPLHTVLRCAQELAQSFQETMLKFKIKKSDNTPPTLSAGITIVHHLELLQEALKAAHSAESMAKAVDGKNALAILMKKRSGEEYSVAGTWKDLERYIELLIAFFRLDDIPRGMAYELREMALRLTTWQRTNDDTSQLQEIIYTEAQRIFHRKLNLPMSRIALQNTTGERAARNGHKQVVLQKLCERVTPVTEKKTSSNSDSTGNGQCEEEFVPKKVSIDEFINELLIAQELAEAAELAQTPHGKEFPA